MFFQTKLNTDFVNRVEKNKENLCARHAMDPCKEGTRLAQNVLTARMRTTVHGRTEKQFTQKDMCALEIRLIHAPLKADMYLNTFWSWNSTSADILNHVKKYITKTESRTIIESKI
jgi:hypothetical protein